MSNPANWKLAMTASVLLAFAAVAGHASRTLAHAHPAQGTGDRNVRVAAEQVLPQMDGGKLKATLVEVTYGVGAASSPHSHPCPVIGYVVSGELRTQVKGSAEAVYKAGETFYEPPNGVHLVSANAGKTESAKLLAIFLCDHETELSTPVPAEGEKGHQ